MQTRVGSLFEALLNVGSGAIVSFCTASVVFPLYGFHSTSSQNFSIVMIFTFVSVVRAYLWRRLFNYITYHRS